MMECVDLTETFPAAASIDCLSTGYKGPQTSLESTFKDHSNEVHTHTLWNYHSCKMCPYKTKSSHIMKSHMGRHHVSRYSKIFNCYRGAIERYKCSQCVYKTSLLVSFNKHLEMSHRKEVEIKVEPDANQPADTMVLMNFTNFNLTNVLKSYTCDSCEFKTYCQLFYILHYTRCPLNQIVNMNRTCEANYHKDFLRWHTFNMQMKIEELPFKCSMCPFRAKRKSILDGHMRVKHPFPKYRRAINRIKKLKNLPFECEVCKWRSRDNISLDRHYNAKHAAPEDTIWYHCQQCNYKTKWHQNVKIHTEGKHANTPWISCKKCRYKTKTQRLMKVHCKTKHQERKKPRTLNCTLCGFTSVHQVGLNNHILFRHANSKAVSWFRCIHCPYKTIFQNNVERHVLRKHGASQAKKVDWLKCEGCDFKSEFLPELREHILTMHVLTEVVVCFKCQLCQFRAIERDAVREHVSEKHIDQKEEWMTCEMCSCQFRQGEELKNHILKNHIL